MQKPVCPALESAEAVRGTAHDGGKVQPPQGFAVLCIEHFGQENELAPRLRHVLGEPRRRRERVHHVRDRTELIHRVQRVHALGNVRHTDRHDLPFPNAVRVQPRGEAVDTGKERIVADPLSLIDERGTPGESLRRTPDRFVEREFEKLLLLGHVSSVSECECESVQNARKQDSA